MLRDLELIEPPEAELVTLAEHKAHLKVESSSEDALIQGYAAAALGALDGYAGQLGRALAEQTWRLYLDSFPAAPIRLPLPPLLGVDAITYLDGDGVEQTLASDQYTVLAGERAEVRAAYGVTFPTTRAVARAVAITFRCGWEAPAGDAPWAAKLQPVRTALLLMVGDLYQNREANLVAQGALNAVVNPTLQQLLKPLRIPRL